MAINPKFDYVLRNDEDLTKAITDLICRRFPHVSKDNPQNMFLKIAKQFDFDPNKVRQFTKDYTDILLLKKEIENEEIE